MSIRKKRQEIKFSFQWFLVFVLVYLVTLIATNAISFSLGKENGIYTAQQVAPAPITSTQLAMPSFEEYLQTPRGLYFGSKNGTRFYPIDCRAGGRVLPENRIWFQNQEEAHASGYTRSAQCP